MNLKTNNFHFFDCCVALFDLVEPEDYFGDFEMSFLQWLFIQFSSRAL